MSDSSVAKVPRTNSNDFNPMWAGDKVYFLSDRNGAVTLFSYDVKSQAVREAEALPMPVDQSGGLNHNERASCIVSHRITCEMFVQ